MVAISRPNTTGYQQNDSEQVALKIDNATGSYELQWAKIGDADSLFLSLCGVRVAYQPPAAP